MKYGKLTQDSFDEALLYFEYLRSKSSISELEQKKLYFMCQEFLDYFTKWMNYSEADANDFKIYVKSTPLAEVLKIEQNEKFV